MATTAQALPRVTTVTSIVPSCTNSHLDQVRLSTATLTTESPLPCQTTKADLWFAETPREQQQAKRLCGGCCIRRQCLAGALRRREPCGIWGGEIFYKGAIVAVQPTRGRRRIQLATTTTRCINQTDQPVVETDTPRKIITPAHGGEKLTERCMRGTIGLPRDLPQIAHKVVASDR